MQAQHCSVTSCGGSFSYLPFFRHAVSGRVCGMASKPKHVHSSWRVPIFQRSRLVYRRNWKTEYQASYRTGTGTKSLTTRIVQEKTRRQQTVSFRQIRRRFILWFLLLWGLTIRMDALKHNFLITPQWVRPLQPHRYVFNLIVILRHHIIHLPILSNITNSILGFLYLRQHYFYEGFPCSALLGKWE